MIHFKNRSGFTLVESAIAMTIAALLLTPMLIIFSTILQRVDKYTALYDGMMVCKKLLCQARQKQEEDTQSFALQHTENDGTTVAYVLEKGVDKQSSLAAVVGLHKEVVTVEWMERGEKKKDQLVTFVYKKAEQKKS
jgi:prepilin-type N-terminal cleavage/methylation domain-containing protein